MNSRSIALSLLLAFVMLVPSVSAAATNLVTNGDLETLGTSSTTTPAGWSADYWGTMTQKFTYPVAGNASARAARVEITKYTSGDAKWYSTAVPVTPGTVYQISDSYRSNVASEVDVYFKVGTTDSYVYVTEPATSGGVWANFSAQITAPAGATSMTIFHVIQSVGYLELDNMSITNGTATTTPPVVVPPAPTSTPTTTPPTTPLLPPLCTLSASPLQIILGSSSVLSWTSKNATAVTINNSVGSVATTSGTKSVAPTATTTYSLTASNSATTTTAVCAATVGVTQPIVVVVPPAPTSTPTTTPIGPNLIPNGTLEAGTTAPTGWTADYWGTMTKSFTYPVTGKNGGKAAKVQITKYTSGDAKWDFAHVAVSSHTVYKYTEDYIATTPTSVTIEYKMADGTYDYEWVANVPTAAAWTPLSLQITVPSTAVSFTVLHALTSVGALTIDNASLVALPASPFAQGMVSFIFDDGLKSQYTNALPMFTTAGYKAGFYIITTEPTSGDSAYMTWAQIKDLNTKGHEIGGHTRTHLALTTLTAAQLQSEVAGSYADLVAQGMTPKNFVYPYGDVNATVETAVKNAGYTGARGSYFGINTPLVDHYNLYDIRLDKTSQLATIKKYIDQAVTDKRWLVLELHDVLATGGDDYAITPAFLQSVITYLKQNNVQVVTMQQGISQLNP